MAKHGCFAHLKKIDLSGNKQSVAAADLCSKSKLYSACHSNPNRAPCQLPGVPLAGWCTVALWAKTGCARRRTASSPCQSSGSTLLDADKRNADADKRKKEKMRVQCACTHTLRGAVCVTVTVFLSPTASGSFVWSMAQPASRADSGSSSRVTSPGAPTSEALRRLPTCRAEEANGLFGCVREWWHSTGHEVEAAISSH